MTDAYIFDALRSPRGKGRADGSLHEVTSVRLSALMLNAIKERNGLEGHAVEDVIWGNVTQVGEQGGCLARTAVLDSDLDERIPGLAINRFCASGMEAVNLAANQVRGGAGGGYIAGGVEMMSRVAMGSDGAAIAVDPSVEARILERLRESEMPSTIVIVAYRTSSIALADEVVFIDEGKIVGHGTHRDLSRDVPGYARIVEAYADDAEERRRS